ncbi:MAG: hypothetical protein HQL09_10210, partial [Nitrospirae bacterium]|nr:hypothetical protein [Nitrospirota bacterium]
SPEIRTLIREGRTHELPQHFDDAGYINTIESAIAELAAYESHKERRARPDRRKTLPNIVSDERRRGDRRAGRSTII